MPFHPLGKPLSECRIALVTTAAPYQPDKGDQGPGAPYNAAAKFYAVYSGDTAKDHDLRISHIAIDRAHTTAEDPGSYFPLPALRATAKAGRIGALAARFHGAADQPQPPHDDRDRLPGTGRALPGRRGRRRLALPNCPVCHQSVSLRRPRAGRKRHRHRGDGLRQGHRRICRRSASPVLRLPARQCRGAPARRARRPTTLDLALRLLEQAPAARTTVQSPLAWADSPDWKLDYCNIERLSADEITARRAEFDRAKVVAKTVRATA